MTRGLEQFRVEKWPMKRQDWLITPAVILSRSGDLAEIALRDGRTWRVSLTKWTRGQPDYQEGGTVLLRGYRLTSGFQPMFGWHGLKVVERLPYTRSDPVIRQAWTKVRNRQILQEN